ncbi:hypothetical protein [Rhizobium leguminosarum]|uniref:hypothetical protein n=1 Tax=Rhizobium leguminosarum TaxID=384 RepID=UPI0021BBBA1E|nr:hypothetical protein [Rhizobium leguminosarum]
MNDSLLREPQVELFFQAYFIGMTLGHLPFFFDDIGFIAFILKFIVSLPIVFVLFIFYRVKYIENKFTAISLVINHFYSNFVADCGGFLVVVRRKYSEAQLVSFFPNYFSAFHPCRMHLLSSYDQAATKERSRPIDSRRRSMPAEKRRLQGRRYIVDCRSVQALPNTRRKIVSTCLVW